jgi:16S rRNA (uracil1498-N3)-methyltransferase
VPKGDKMETIVRMATELGVARVQPALTERTIVQLEASRWRERARRWQRVAKEATKQCGRAVVPEVDVPQPLGTCLDALGAPAPRELRVCVWEGASAPLAAALDAAEGATRVHVLVGPEGGLAVPEVEAARRAGFGIASLGPRVLRTETAGAVVIALLQYRLGDLSR